MEWYWTVLSIVGAANVYAAVGWVLGHYILSLDRIGAAMVLLWPVAFPVFMLVVFGSIVVKGE